MSDPGLQFASKAPDLCFVGSPGQRPARETRNFELAFEAMGHDGAHAWNDELARPWPAGMRTATTRWASLHGSGHPRVFGWLGFDRGLLIGPVMNRADRGQRGDEMPWRSPESHALACLRRLDGKLDRQHAATGARVDRVESRLDQIADELLVLHGIVLRREGAKSRLRGRRQCPTAMSAGSRT